MRRPLLLLLLFAGVSGAQTQEDGWSRLRRYLDEGKNAQELLPVRPVVRAIVTAPVSVRPAVLRLPALDSRRLAVRNAACRYRVPPSLALAVFDHESGFDNSRQGAKGEIGAAQIMPGTARYFGFDLDKLHRDYLYNIESGVTILRSLLDIFNDDEIAAVHGYNGGPGWQDSSRDVQAKIAHYTSAVVARRRDYAGVECE